MENTDPHNPMTPDAAARQALRVALAEIMVVAENWRLAHGTDRAGAIEAVEVLSEILEVLAARARGALDADGANVDVLVEWALADMADELT